MPKITLTPCGLSVFTQGTRYEHIKFLKRNENKLESEYNQSELRIFNQIIEVRREKLIEASLDEAKNLSSELKSFIVYYEKNFDDAKNDLHFLIHSDTFQGEKAAELIKIWGEFNEIIFTPVLIKNLNTLSLKNFEAGIKNLFEWCKKFLPEYKSQGRKIIFNLNGGFKSLQFYMNKLGNFYADEIIFIFENGEELIKIRSKDFNS